MVIDCKWFNGNPYNLSYIKNKNYGFSLWKNIMSLNNAIFQYSKSNIGNGNKTHFWDDIWYGSERLRDKYSFIFAIARNKSAMVNEAAGSLFLPLGASRYSGTYKIGSWKSMNPCSTL